MFIYVQVDYRLQTKPQKLLQLEEVLDKITSHFVEATTYTRTNHKMSIHIGEVPPIIAPSQRHSEVFNTEVDKKSVYITDKSDIEGLLRKLLPITARVLFMSSRFISRDTN